MNFPHLPIESAHVPLVARVPQFESTVLEHQLFISFVQSNFPSFCGLFPLIFHILLFVWVFFFYTFCPVKIPVSVPFTAPKYSIWIDTNRFLFCFICQSNYHYFPPTWNYTLARTAFFVLMYRQHRKSHSRMSSQIWFISAAVG